MNHWIWKDDLQTENQASLGTRPALIRDRDLRFDDGILMDPLALGAPLDITLSHEDDGYLTDNLVAPGFPGLLISARLRTVFEKSGVDNIQYFPINLLTSTGTAPIHQYFIANIVGKVGCIDIDRSDITMTAGPPTIIDAIDHLVLHEHKIQNLNIFRLGEIPVVIFINSRIRDAVEKSRASGVSFYPIDEFVF